MLICTGRSIEFASGNQDNACRSMRLFASEESKMSISVSSEPNSESFEALDGLCNVPQAQQIANCMESIDNLL